MKLGLHEVWILFWRGWALENLRADRDAQRVYEEALRLEPDNPYLLKASGNTLYLLDDVEGAREEYRSAIEQARKSVEERDAHSLALEGWCYYRLGEYDEAIQLFRDALSLDMNIVYVKFDLALTLMCYGQHHTARHEYDRALESTQSQHILRRRGLLHVALSDLELAVERQQNLHEVAEVREVLTLLETDWSEVKNSTPAEL
jgi:tetratricopeptide (TPR) repeat protein